MRFPHCSIVVSTATLLLLASFCFQASGDPCSARSFGQDSVVCVCDAHRCDLPGRLTFPDPGHFTVVTSSRDGLRFHVDTKEVDDMGEEEEDPTGTTTIEVDLEDRRQVMVGFGAAFTDASGINLAALSPGAREMALRSYFSPEGIEYELSRVPIGSCDFSVKPYSYAEVEGDVELEHFKLAEEDLLYKIPQLRRAQELSERPLRVVGSPWSPPTWMKTNGKHNESGQLIREMWRPWADYLVRFVKAYEEEGIPIWGITTQNDPLSGFDPNYKWNSLGWTDEDMRDWIKESLGPAVEEAGLQDRLRVMIHDQDRIQLSWHSHATLQDPDAARYVSGVAVHWYADTQVGPKVLDEIHDSFPDKFLLYSEACTGFDAPDDEKVLLGSWARAESYAKNIIEGANHWVTGWLDWNLALDTTGGPNWAGNRVDAPVIVNATADEFYKQPMFYALGHFSKFVPAGSVHVTSRVVKDGDDEGDDEGDLHAAAFTRADGGNVLILLNTKLGRCRKESSPSSSRQPIRASLTIA